MTSKPATRPGRRCCDSPGARPNDLINWSADTITLVPGIEARYRHLFGPVQLTVTSRFKYFHTQPIERSTTALSFESTSQWWLNEVDVEWRMPLYLWGRQLRTGAYVSRSELFGGVEETFKTNYLYQAGGRFVMDIQGLLWHVEYCGRGGRVLLVGQVLGLVGRGRDQLRVLKAATPADSFLAGHFGPRRRIQQLGVVRTASGLNGGKRGQGV